VIDCLNFDLLFGPVFTVLKSSLGHLPNLCWSKSWVHAFYIILLRFGKCYELINCFNETSLFFFFLNFRRMLGPKVLMIVYWPGSKGKTQTRTVRSPLVMSFDVQRNSTVIKIQQIIWNLSLIFVNSLFSFTIFAWLLICHIFWQLIVISTSFSLSINFQKRKAKLSLKCCIYIFVSFIKH